LKKDTQDPAGPAKAYKKKNEWEEARRQPIVTEKVKRLEKRLTG
jgi:hypothetical protein